MGWRVTVKAGKVRDMKNKRRKTGKKRGWSGGSGPDNGPKVVPGSDPSPGPETVQSAAANPTSSTAEPNIIIHRDVLDQNNLCIALDNGHVIIKQDKQNCIVNACLYYAINNLIHDFPKKIQTDTIIALINSLIDDRDKIIEPTNTFLEYAPINSDDKRFMKLIQWCLTTYKIKFVTIQNNRLAFIEHVNLGEYDDIADNLYNTSDPLPWDNDSLSVVALVQGLRNHDEKDENINNGTGHFIAIKIVGDDVHIADSFHSDNPIYIDAHTVPIDRKNDPFVKKIIDGLFDIRTTEKAIRLGAFSNQISLVSPIAATGTSPTSSSPIDTPPATSPPTSSSTVPPSANPNVAAPLLSLQAPEAPLPSPITVVAAPNTTLTIAPTGTVPEPLLISFVSIVGKASGSTAKSTTYIFNDGTSITTEPLNKQEYKCTFSPSSNLIAQP